MTMMTLYETPVGLQALGLIVLFLVSITSYAKRLTLLPHYPYLPRSNGIFDYMPFLNGDKFVETMTGKEDLCVFRKTY